MCMNPPCCSRGRSAARSPGCSTAATWPQHVLPRRPGEPSPAEGRGKEGRKPGRSTGGGAAAAAERAGRSLPESSRSFGDGESGRAAAQARWEAANRRAAGPGSGAAAVGKCINMKLFGALCAEFLVELQQWQWWKYEVSWFRPQQKMEENTNYFAARTDTADSLINCLPLKMALPLPGTFFPVYPHFEEPPWFFSEASAQIRQPLLLQNYPG